MSLELIIHNKGCIYRMQVRLLKKALYSSKLFAESWYIAYRRKTSNIINDKSSAFTVIKNAPNCWAADPFVIEVEGKAYIFAELYEFSRGRGAIGYYALDNQEKGWKTVIIEPYHLSYPHIFQKGNNIYLMPESNESYTLYCYRATCFPDKWEKLQPIRTNVRYTDTSLFEWKEKKFALTYSIKENGENELVLLDFQNRDKDRVIELSNVELRRPGGKIYSDKQIRVAQNCQHGYGKGLIFYHYDIDQYGKYTEEEIERLIPEQMILSKNLYLDGMHTYNVSEHYEVIDIKTRAFSLLQFILRVKGKLNRIVMKQKVDKKS